MLSLVDPDSLIQLIPRWSIEVADIVLWNKNKLIIYKERKSLAE